MDEAVYKCDNTQCMYPFRNFKYKNFTENIIYRYEKVEERSESMSKNCSDELGKPKSIPSDAYLFIENEQIEENSDFLDEFADFNGSIYETIKQSNEIVDNYDSILDITFNLDNLLESDNGNENLFESSQSYNANEIEDIIEDLCKPTVSSKTIFENSELNSTLTDVPTLQHSSPIKTSNIPSISIEKSSKRKIQKCFLSKSTKQSLSEPNEVIPSSNFNGQKSLKLPNSVNGKTTKPEPRKTLMLSTLLKQNQNLTLQEIIDQPHGSNKPLDILQNLLKINRIDMPTNAPVKREIEKPAKRKYTRRTNVDENIKKKTISETQPIHSGHKKIISIKPIICDTQDSQWIGSTDVFNSKLKNIKQEPVILNFAKQPLRK